MLTDFYVAFSTVCFTLLACGSSWSRPAMPSGAKCDPSAAALWGGLALLAARLVSLLSLVDPAGTTLWRMSFAIVLPVA